MTVTETGLSLTFTDAFGNTYTQNRYAKSYCDSCTEAEHLTIVADLCATDLCNANLPYLSKLHRCRRWTTSVMTHAQRM